MALTKITLSGAKDTILAAFTKVNDIIDDLLSTVSGLGASTVGIEDSASNMAAANVEDALAEIYSDVSSSRTALDTLDANPATTTGTTWGFKGGLVRFDNVVATVTAATVSLTDDAVNYVEVAVKATSPYYTVSRNTTAFTKGRIPIRQITVASGIQTVSTDKRAWFHQGLALIDADGDTQIQVEESADDDTIRFDCAGSEQVTITDGAITPTTDDDIVLGTTAKAYKEINLVVDGLHIQCATDASHDLIISPGSNLTGDKTLTITTGDANRTITFTGNPTLADWFDQPVKQASNVIFNEIYSEAGEIYLKDAGDNNWVILTTSEDVSPSRRIYLNPSNADRTVTISGNPTLADWFDQPVKQAATPEFAGLTANSNGVLAGDTTAGRVIRVAFLSIIDGAGGDTIKASLLDRWNGDTMALSGDIAKSATVDNFTLDAVGSRLTIEAAGLTGNAVAVISASIARWGAAAEASGFHTLNVAANIVSNDIILDFYSGTNANYDLPAGVDVADTIGVYICYITDA